MKTASSLLFLPSFTVTVCGDGERGSWGWSVVSGDGGVGDLLGFALLLPHMSASLVLAPPRSIAIAAAVVVVTVMAVVVAAATACSCAFTLCSPGFVVGGSDKAKDVCTARTAIFGCITV
jgi:hypothetical protein